MKYPPRGMHLPDTSHLAPEDAELFVALYIERNCVSRGELQRVRIDAERAARSRQQAVNGAGDELGQSSRNVVTRVQNAHLTCENDSSKTAPGPVVGATGRVRGLTPETHSEAPMNHAPSGPCRQQVAL